MISLPDRTQVSNILSYEKLVFHFVERSHVPIERGKRKPNVKLKGTSAFGTEWGCFIMIGLALPAKGHFSRWVEVVVVERCRCTLTVFGHLTLRIIALNTTEPQSVDFLHQLKLFLREKLEYMS